MLSLTSTLRVYLNCDAKFRAALQSYQGTLGVEVRWSRRAAMTACIDHGDFDAPVVADAIHNLHAQGIVI